MFLFTIQVLGASKNDDLVATLFRLCNYDEIEGLSFQEIQHCQVSKYNKIEGTPILLLIWVEYILNEHK